VLGLDGFAVTAVRERGDELDLEVELVVAAAVCPHCGRASLEVKERPLVRVRDLPIAGRRTTLCWRKRHYRYEACRRTFSESDPELPPRQRVTARFRRHLFSRVRGGAAHAEVAREEETTRYQVAHAFSLGAARELAERRGRPAARRLALDEAAHRRGSQALATVVCDLDRRCVVDVVDGRDRRTIERRQAVEVISIDPYEAYRQAVRAALPAARIVVDPFHLVRGANTAVDSVRRERQRFVRQKRRTGARQTRGTAWRAELFRARHRLLKARERLTERERRKLCELFASEPLLAEAWGLKEAFRFIYRAADRAEAERRLERFLAAAERAAIPSFSAFANGLRGWRTELLAYFEEPTTNGYAEGVINKIKTIKRRAYGLPSFESFRRRVLRSMRLTGSRSRSPLNRRDPRFRPALTGGRREHRHRGCATCRSRLRGPSPSAGRCRPVTRSGGRTAPRAGRRVPSASPRDAPSA
jgi:transposase